MWRALWRGVRDLVLHPGSTSALSAGVLNVTVVGMHAKVGLVCQVWVSLEIWCLGNELSIDASEGQTVLLQRR